MLRPFSKLYTKIVRMFKMRTFQFNKTASQLSLQNMQWNLCVRCFQGAWSRCVLVASTDLLTLLIWPHAICFCEATPMLRCLNIVRGFFKAANREEMLTILPYMLEIVRHIWRNPVNSYILNIAIVWTMPFVKLQWPTQLKVLVCALYFEKCDCLNFLPSFRSIVVPYP